MRPDRARTLAIVVVLGFPALAAAGWKFPGAPQHPCRDGAPEPGTPRAIPNTHARAGYPQCLAPHAQQSRTPGGIGYHVGGGAPAGHGDGRCRADGTWGWDETGFPRLRRRVVLGWWHGRRHQGGAGQYEPDGPHVPDVIAGAQATLEAHHEPGHAGGMGEGPGHE